MLWCCICKILRVPSSNALRTQHLASNSFLCGHLLEHADIQSIGERLRGNTIRSNKTESLREENLPPRESPRGPLKTSERATLVMKIKSQKGISQRLSEVLGGPLGDPLGGQFASRRLSVLLPLIVLPLSVSPNQGLVSFFSVVAMFSANWQFTMQSLASSSEIQKSSLEIPTKLVRKVFHRKEWGAADNNQVSNGCVAGTVLT